MSREIKFRQFIDGDMRTFGFIKTKHGIEFWGPNKSSTDDYPVMQFTGLRDCNGVEIYEGDVVTIKDYDDGDYYMTGVVKFGVRGYPAFEVYDVNGNQYTDEYNSLTNDELKIEVIGNIHQNPELLGGAQ